MPLFVSTQNTTAQKTRLAGMPCLPAQGQMAAGLHSEDNTWNQGPAQRPSPAWGYPTPSFSSPQALHSDHAPVLSPCTRIAGLPRQGLNWAEDSPLDLPSFKVHMAKSAHPLPLQLNISTNGLPHLPQKRNPKASACRKIKKWSVRVMRNTTY